MQHEAEVVGKRTEKNDVARIHIGAQCEPNAAEMGSTYRVRYQRESRRSRPRSPAKARIIRRAGTC